MAANMRMAVLCDTGPCRLAEVDGHLRAACIKSTVEAAGTGLHGASSQKAVGFK
jgi:hypothetical protein